MRTGRSPTVAGTTTHTHIHRYQPPFHRIIYLAAGDSTPTTSCSKIGRVRSRSVLLAAFSSTVCIRSTRRRALTLVRRESSVGLYRFASSFSESSLFAVVSQPDSPRELWECIPRDLVECESFKQRARATGERLLANGDSAAKNIIQQAKFNAAPR